MPALKEKLLVLILCSSFEAKKVGSTAGMQESVRTSLLLKNKAVQHQEHMSMLDILKKALRLECPADYSTVFDIMVREA